MGVLEAVRDGMVGLAGHAITIKEASDRVFVCDVKGLIAEDGCSPEEWASFTPEQQMFAAKKGSGFTRGMSLQEVAAKAKPSVLLGLSAVGGLFKVVVIAAVYVCCAGVRARMCVCALPPLLPPSHRYAFLFAHG